MSDDDPIRRGDALAAVDAAYEDSTVPRLGAEDGVDGTFVIWSKPE